MSNVLANSYKGAAQAKAWNQGLSPERMAERSAAYADKEARDQDLRTLKATEPTDRDRATMAEAQSVELQNALETQKAMLRDNVKRTTFSAYERYDADGDVRHINTMLIDLEKSGSKLYGKVARVDVLTENDRQLLEDANLHPSLIDEILKNPELNKSYVKVTQKDGTISFGDVDVLKGLTGYNDYADAKELARQKTAREIEMMATMGYDLDPAGREAFRRVKAELGPDVDPMSPEFQQAYTEAYDELKRAHQRGRTGSAASASILGTGSPTEREAQAARLAMQRTGLQPSPLGENPEWDRAMAQAMSEVNSEFQRPAATRNIEGAEQARAELETEGFWEMDLDNITPKDRGRWEGKIRRIEQLSGAELSERDKTSLERIQRLTSLGDMASGLTDEQTGIIDNVLKTAKKYVMNSPEGTEARAAYSAYRNLVQHALYGSALTPNEAKNFSKQLGSLSQQRGPILGQFRTTMQELLDVYQAIARTNDPMVMAWRTGKTGAELADVIDGLEDRIELIENLRTGGPAKVINPPVQVRQNVPTLTPEREAELRKIFEDQ